MNKGLQGWRMVALCGLAQAHLFLAGAVAPGWSWSLAGVTGPQGQMWGQEGGAPYCAPLVVGTNIYVVTSSGALGWKAGDILQLSFDGTKRTPLWLFGIANDGAHPVGQLLLVNSNLMGMTPKGGTADQGVIFQFNLSNQTETVLHNFSGGPTNGAYPYGSLLASGNTLYGMTSQGGVSNVGVVFSYNLGLIALGQERFKVLHQFTGGPADGKYPEGSLVLAGNMLYGLTPSGGTQDEGCLFGLTTNGTGYGLLHHFTIGASDGHRPYNSLTMSGSTLYGTCIYGGVSNCGVVFSYYTGLLRLGQSRFNLLHQFADMTTEGKYPFGNIAIAGNTLYGMTSAGGSANKGMVFRLSATGTGYTNLLSFTGSGTGPAAGAYPYETPTIFGRYLFGTTVQGGTYGSGTVFRLDLPVEPKLFFQTDVGQMAMWKLSTNGIYAGSALMENTGAWALKAAGDIDGDGVADLLFQDGSHNMAGWLMNLDVTKHSGSFWSNTGAWDLKACADFEGTGRAQVLFQKPDGSLALWRLNPDGSYNSSAGLGNSTAAWPLRGAADLDGDGKADLIFQNAAGDLAVWKHLPNGTITGGVLPGAGTWILRGTVDVDGNGAGDLVWQAANGSVVGWFMNTNLTPMTTFPLLSSGVYKLKAGGR